VTSRITEVRIRPLVGEKFGLECSKGRPPGVHSAPMLLSTPTNHGAGVILSGDSSDLGGLLATIRRLYDGIPFDGTLEEFLYDLAHEIDRASMGIVVSKIKGHAEREENYRWIVRRWPTFLTEVGMLRWAAAFHETSKRDQANLFALEACAEGALLRFDRQVGKDAVEWLTYFNPLPQTYLVQFIEEVDAMYVRGSNRGKARFSRLPHFLRMLSPTSAEYKAFEERLFRQAKEKNCNPSDLQRAEDFPTFEW
jgi:hypothetical protein